MTIKEYIEKLKLAKNKDAEIVFRVGDCEAEVELMAEVISENGEVRFPELGEITNAVAIKIQVLPVADLPAKKAEMTIVSE